MNLSKQFSLRVIPNSSRNELAADGEHLRLYIHAPPEKDKANKEVIKFFKKEMRVKVEIVSGLKSRDKIIRVLEG
ncbi:YggU family protein [Candidatus Woesearchaeota archaeon]|nr:YggU family protein [Candidatus Woesearchaeota archaeon]